MTENNPNLYSQLSEHFPQEMERSLNKGGTRLTYIPVSEVINRLNKVLGVDRWSFTVVKCERDATDPDFVVAHVRLEYNINEFSSIVRDGIGGQKIKRTKQDAIVDLGDEFKGAISDALKKAAQTMGVGLYLARSEEAMEIEQAIDASPVQPTAASSQFVQVKEMFDALNDDEKKQVKAFWSDHSGGSKKKLSEMNDDELNLISAEIVRLKFGGTMVDAGN
jgi:recombination DNA repair RAD52 pathway protein